MGNYEYRMIPRSGTNYRCYDVLYFDRDYGTDRVAASYLPKETALLFTNAQTEHKLLYDLVKLIESREDHKLIAEKCAAAKALFERATQALEEPALEEFLPCEMTPEHAATFDEDRAAYDLKMEQLHKKLQAEGEEN